MILQVKNSQFINNELSMKLGCENQSRMLLQLAFYDDISNNGRGFYKTFNKLQEESFPMWSERKIKRVISDLKEKELIKIGKKKSKYTGNINYYTINYNKLSKLGLKTIKVNMPDSHLSRCKNDTQRDTRIKYIVSPRVVSFKKISPPSLKILDKYLESLDKYEKDENIYMSDLHNSADIKIVFDTWNHCFKDVRQIFTYDGLTSEYPKVVNAIYKCLESYSVDMIVSAIKNYYDIFLSDYYFYSYKWTLDSFILAGLKNGKGVFSFLDSSNPHERYKNKFKTDIYKSFRDRFNPIDVKFDRQKLLDKEHHSYFGIDIDRVLDDASVKQKLRKIRENIDKDIFTYDNIKKLQEVISNLLFRKGDAELINELINIHNSRRVEFIEGA